MVEVDPDQAREQARQVLDGDRYRSSDVPRPLQGVLRWIGDRAGDVGEPLLDALDTPLGLALALLVAAAVAVAVAVTVARRRTRRHETGVVARRRAARPDPGALDAEAERAEADGDLAGAVRLRFRAGVLRLEQAGVVAARSDATTARLLASVATPAFVPLARSFDEVAYGGRAATPADVDAARRGWPTVLAGAGARAAAVGEPSS